MVQYFLSDFVWLSPGSSALSQMAGLFPPADSYLVMFVHFLPDLHSLAEGHLVYW